MCAGGYNLEESADGFTQRIRARLHEDDKIYRRKASGLLARGAWRLVRLNDLAALPHSRSCGGFPQEARRDRPLPAVVSYDRDRLLVVSDEHSSNGSVVFGLKRNAFTDRELQHPNMGVHLMKHAQPLDDLSIQIDEFRFGKVVDIDSHAGFQVKILRLSPQKVTQRLFHHLPAHLGD